MIQVLYFLVMPALVTVLGGLLVWHSNRVADIDRAAWKTQQSSGALSPELRPEPERETKAVVSKAAG